MCSVEDLEECPAEWAHASGQLGTNPCQSFPSAHLLPSHPIKALCFYCSHTHPRPQLEPTLSCVSLSLLCVQMCLMMDRDWTAHPLPLLLPHPSGNSSVRTWDIITMLCNLHSMCVCYVCIVLCVCVYIYAEGPIEMVNYFTYLGSNVTVDGEIRDEVKCRIAKAAKAFGCLQRSIFRNRRL